MPGLTHQYNQKQLEAGAGNRLNDPGNIRKRSTQVTRSQGPAGRHAQGPPIATLSPMPHPVIEKFIHALQQLEQTQEFGELIALFSEQCSISNLAVAYPPGRESAHRFWQEYLGAFQEVHTDFTRVTEQGHLAFLEWISEGCLQSGRPMTYEGVTVLEIHGDQIVRFKAYYDSAVFLQQGGKHSERLGQINVKPLTTNKVMEGGPNRDTSTPSEGVLTSKITDRDAATD